METLFVSSLNANLALAWVICIVLLLRLIFKRISKRLCLFLWLIVGLRCVLPFSFHSTFSFLPSSQVFDPGDMFLRSFRIHSGLNIIDDYINDYLGGHYYEGISVPVETMLRSARNGAVIWVIGMVILTVLLIAGIVALRRRLRTAVIYEGNIWQSDMIRSPFVFGILRPKIHVPFNMQGKDFSRIIAHEREHIRHGDHIWKLLFYVILIIYWYNPLMWVAYKKFSDDLEFACDERVISKLNEDERKAYAITLLNYAARTPLRFAERLYFGCEKIRDRIESIINYKDRNRFLIAVFVLILFIVACGVLADPDPNADNNLLDILQRREVK